MNHEPTTEAGFMDSIFWPSDPPSKPQDKYFESYSHYGIHEDMLKDKQRTKAFKSAILNNKFLFKDKIVLDIGCGTGILSFFAAKAGASHVYAIDNSSIILSAMQIAEINKFSKITFIHGKVEEVSLPVSSVDIIISDWMGYFLLYENMLETIIYARNKWLVPGGLMFPDRARLFFAGIEDAKFKDEKFEFWNDVYGIDMSLLRGVSLKEAHIEEITSDAILSTSFPIFEVDLLRISAEEIEFVSQYEIQFTRNDFMHALMAWFEVSFNQCHVPVSFSTSPRVKETRWKQTVFYLENSQPVCVGQILRGSVAIRKNLVEPRGLDIKISFKIVNTKYPLNTVQYFSLTR